jgi:hypothetical protein
MKSISLGVIVALGLLGSGLAQDSGDVETPPFEISGIQVIPGPFPPGDTLSFTIRNLSPKAVHGYVLRIDLLDIQGRSHTGRTFSAEKSPLPGAKGQLSPGESWIENWSLGVEHIDNIPVQFTGARIYVDYVRFADGSSWGPDKRGQGIAIGRARQGALEERSRLKRLLAERGVQALLDDLTQEIDPPR